MSTLPLTDEEWKRLCAYQAITRAGGTLDGVTLLDCDALAGRIKIPRPQQDKTLPPGTPPPTTPITSEPPDSMAIA